MPNYRYRDKQTGFSLLELMLVLSLMGILSALATKKYIELRHVANITVLQGTQLSLQGAADLTFSKSLLAGSANNLAGTVSIQEKDPFNDAVSRNKPFIVATRYGYPQGRWSELVKILELDSSRWHYSELRAEGIEGLEDLAQVVLWLTGSPGSLVQCNISYQSAIAAGSRPQITINKTGC